MTDMRKVVKDEDFLSLSSEDLVKLILCNDLAVPFEEKVGDGNRIVLKTVKYYGLTLDTWTPVAKMSVYCDNVSVGVLDIHMYAIGGYDGEYLQCWVNYF
ncbi:hypothetical protein QTP88_028352 [Uroleucon formosanum]